MAPRVGIEPTAKGLTVPCSTAELPRNLHLLRCGGSLTIRLFCGKGQAFLTSRDQKLIHSGHGDFVGAAVSASSEQAPQT